MIHVNGHVRLALRLALSLNTLLARRSLRKHWRKEVGKAHRPVFPKEEILGLVTWNAGVKWSSKLLILFILLGVGLYLNFP